MLANYTFNETSPSSASTVISSQPVGGVLQSAFGPGVLGPVHDFLALQVFAEITGATGGTLNLYIQGTTDNANWYDIVSFPTITPGLGTTFYSIPLSLSCNTAGPVKVGKNASPVLAQNTTVNGAWTDRLRLVMVAGASTSAGANVVVRVGGQRPTAREAGT